MLVVVYFVLTSKRKTLTGLLIDLELATPDEKRHEELQRFFLDVTRDSSLQGIDVTLRYIHFTHFTGESDITKNIDFIVLSPQSTPWSNYLDDAAISFSMAQQSLKTIISSTAVPVLGICGGHQFLALTYGAKVDFMDPSLYTKKINRYPKGVISERGPHELQILKPDPILEGLHSDNSPIIVIESHHEEVKEIPENFDNLARTKNSEIQLLKMKNKNVYGTAFHPERKYKAENGELVYSEGREMVLNFLHIVMGKRD